MKILSSIFLLGALLIFCGCSTESGIKPEQTIAPLLAMGSGAAGYLAAKDQDEDERALITGAAALGGLAVGSFIADDVAEAKRKEFRDGYNLAIKRLYWRQQAQHRAKPDEPRLKYYAFPGRESGDNGEKLMKHDVVMPVME